MAHLFHPLPGAIWYRCRNQARLSSTSVIFAALFSPNRVSCSRIKSRCTRMLGLMSASSAATRSKGKTIYRGMKLLATLIIGTWFHARLLNRQAVSCRSQTKTRCENMYSARMKSAWGVMSVRRPTKSHLYSRRNLNCESIWLKRMVCSALHAKVTVIASLRRRSFWQRTWRGSRSVISYVRESFTYSMKTVVSLRKSSNSWDHAFNTQTVVSRVSKMDPSRH